MPKVSDVVLYRLTAAEIQAYGSELNGPYNEGDSVPAIVARVVDTDPEGTGSCNLRLLPDGVAVPGVVNIPRGDQPGQWHEPTP